MLQARLTGQTSGAALAALCFGLAGREAGATLALVLGVVFAAVGCAMSVLRLVATPQSKCLALETKSRIRPQSKEIIK